MHTARVSPVRVHRRTRDRTRLTFLGRYLVKNSDGSSGDVPATPLLANSLRSYRGSADRYQFLHSGLFLGLIRRFGLCTERHSVSSNLACNFSFKLKIKLKLLILLLRWTHTRCSEEIIRHLRKVHITIRERAVMRSLRIMMKILLPIIRDTFIEVLV